MENLKIPNMILIGATARNSGKTALAAAIINKYKSKRPVVAVKVTTVAEKGGKCIRGGEGCGACSGLKGDFEITEEHDKISKKDTSMLLAAGAEKVFWLKVLRSHLLEGIQEVISHIPGDSIIVCESNSLRKIAEPGISVMIANDENSGMKKSAEEVISKADIVFENNFKDDFGSITDEIDKILQGQNFLVR